jgi:hypothetical protein
VTGYFDNKSDWHVFHRAQITALAPGSKKTQKLFVGFNVPATYNPITNVSTTQYYGLFVCQDVTASAVDKAGVRVPKCAFTQINGTGPNALPAVPITSIQVLPHDNDQVIIVGTTIGVFYTSNGGTTWINISNDGAFPAGIGVTHIRYEPSTSYLYATTNGRGVWAKYIPSDPTLNPLFKGNFQLYPTLQEYRGNRAKLSITAQFYAGGQPINGTAQKGSPPVPQPFEYDISNLSASGWWINGTSVSGAYNIWFKVTGFLSKRMINTQIASNTLVSPLVYNGDCNPIYNANGQIVSYGDNVIDINDYNAVISHLGQIWTGPEDVDGDGIVTLRDLDIILANFGLIGDP